MSEAPDDAVERKLRDVGAGILNHGEAGFRAADFGNRGCDCTRQRAAPCDSALRRRASDRDRIDQIGIEQQRRTLEHERGDIGLIVRECVHDGGGCRAACRKHLCERAAHQRRHIVEQHDHRAFGGGAIVIGEIGIQIGACQRRGGFGAVGGFRRSHPLQEMTNDHAVTTRLERRERDAAPAAGPAGISLRRAA